MVVVVKEEIDGTAVGQVEINSSPASQDYEGEPGEVDGASSGCFHFFWGKAKCCEAEENTRP